jgi:hypothetical protein
MARTSSLRGGLPGSVTARLYHKPVILGQPFAWACRPLHRIGSEMAVSAWCPVTLEQVPTALLVVIEKPQRRQRMSLACMKPFGTSVKSLASRGVQLLSNAGGYFPDQSNRLNYQSA